MKYKPSKLDTMIYMLCRNRVKDFDVWKTIFDSHLKSQEEVGLKLIEMWRDIEEPNNVFFNFEVESVEKAKDFINNPESAKAGEISGVIDGECHFIEKL